MSTQWEEVVDQAIVGDIEVWDKDCDFRDDDCIEAYCPECIYNKEETEHD